MKILAPTSGVVPAKLKAYYIIDIASRLDAELLVLYIKGPNEGNEKGEAALKIFSNLGKHEHIVVKTRIKQEKVVSAIIQIAEEESVDFIIMGASDGKDVGEWISADVMSKSTIPMLIIPHALNQNSTAFRSFIC